MVEKTNLDDDNNGPREIGTSEQPELVSEELTSNEIKKLFTELEVDEPIGELFYNSVKIIFDTGFHLAKRLNFDFIADSIEKAEEKQKSKLKKNL
ncbi:MAG: hypothetical protein ACTSYC_05430 [Promethearchaeota archaeon]